MRLLLDTHAFLWMLEDPTRLGDTARSVMEDGGNELPLSVGSCREMAIKQAAGRLTLPAPFEAFVNAQLAANRVGMLPSNVAHLGRLAGFPRHLREHRDPFDRLLAAQSLAEGVPIISRDTRLGDYSVERVW